MTSKKLIMNAKEEKIFNENTIKIIKPKIITKSTKKKVVKKENKELITEVKIELKAEDFKDIIIDISESTHYKLDWFTLKLKVMLPFRIAYKKYEKWFNNIFNKVDTYGLTLTELLPEYQSDESEYQSDNLEELFENIPKIKPVNIFPDKNLNALSPNEIIKLRSLLKSLEEGK